MKNVSTLLFLFTFPMQLFAQENNTLKDANLKTNVAKVTEKGYRYDVEADHYINISTTESEYVNGFLQFSSLEYNDFLAEWTDTFYRYNEDNTLKEVTYVSAYDSTTTTVTFQYANKKPVVRKEFSDITIIRNFEYDANGNLALETKLDEDGDVIEKVLYSNYTSGDSYQKEITSFDGEKIVNSTKETYANGLLTQKNFTSEYTNETTIYAYDSNRLRTRETSNDFVTAENNYITDANGNAVKTRMYVNGGGIIPDMNIFLFTEYTYADGKVTGSCTFDAEFIKQFEPESKSYEVGEAMD